MRPRKQVKLDTTIPDSLGEKKQRKPRKTTRLKKPPAANFSSTAKIVKIRRQKPKISANNGHKKKPSENASTKFTKNCVNQATKKKRQMLRKFALSVTPNIKEMAKIPLENMRLKLQSSARIKHPPAITHTVENLSLPQNDKPITTSTQNLAFLRNEAYKDLLDRAQQNVAQKLDNAKASNNPTILKTPVVLKYRQEKCKTRILPEIQAPIGKCDVVGSILLKM